MDWDEKCVTRDEPYDSEIAKPQMGVCFNSITLLNLF